MLTDLLNQVVEKNQPEQCILNGFESYKFTPSTGKAYTLASVTQQGRVAKIKVYQGSGQQFSQAQIGQMLNFNLKSYRAQNGNIYVSGFWNERAQNTQQPSQTPPQSTNSVQSGAEINLIHLVNRIAIALEKIADNNQSFEQKYKLNEDQGEQGDCVI